MSLQDNRVPGGIAQNDQVEINLSGREQQYEMKEIDPYASENKEEVMNRESHMPVNPKDIDVNAFSGAQYASQKSDDPNMYTSKSNVQFQKGACYTPACMGIRRLFNLIGCLFGIANSAFDLLYFIKSPFSSKTLYLVAIVAVVLRMVVNFSMCQYLYSKWVWNYRPGLAISGEDKYREEEADAGQFGSQSQDQDQEGHQSRKEIESKKFGVWLYSIMHFLYYTGSFRLLPSVHFPAEMVIAYSIELFLGILPIMFIQILNHSSLQSDLIPIQSVAMVIKLVSLLVFIFEIFIMIWEIILNRKMRKLKIDGFQKISEESRRSQYSKKFASCGCLSFVAYVAIVVLGLTALQSRNTALKDQLSLQTNATAMVGQTIELGVLVNCSKNCLNCDGDSTKCKQCAKGLYPSSQDGLCQDCDEYDDQIICHDCQEREDKQGADCKECANGYILVDGTCQACKVSRCADCSTDLEKCNKCFEGQVWDQKLERCRSCELEGDGMAHCSQCALKRVGGETKADCLACQPGVAKLLLQGDGLHRCFDCQNGYTPTKNDKGDQTGCECKGYGQESAASLAKDAKCESCDQVIPGCQKCVRTQSKPDHSFYVTLRDEKVLDDDVVQPAEYVYCATPAKGLFPYKRNGVTTYRKCEEIQKGCKPGECWADGSACHHCKEGWYRIQTNVFVDGKRKNRCGWCGVKRIFGEGCEECNLSQGCTRCGDGKWKFGYKCINKLW